MLFDGPQHVRLHRHVPRGARLGAGHGHGHAVGRRLITEQFTIAVRAGRLDIDLANGMLAGCGLPPLPRRWTVRLVMTFVCEVTAANAIDAFDTAQDAIAAAVTDAACPIDVDWDSREDVHATPGDIDPQAL